MVEKRGEKNHVQFELVEMIDMCIVHNLNCTYTYM